MTTKCNAQFWTRKKIAMKDIVQKLMQFKHGLNSSNASMPKFLICNYGTMGNERMSLFLENTEVLKHLEPWGMIR